MPTNKSHEVQLESYMEEKVLAQLLELKRHIDTFEASAKRALGFFRTIEYKGITFNVSHSFVVAELSPLAFVNFVEHIDVEGAEAAVVRLYETLLPLLECRHRWTVTEQVLAENVPYPALDFAAASFKIYVCESCTAYAVSRSPGELPSVGRDVS